MTDQDNQILEIVRSVLDEKEESRRVKANGIDREIGKQFSMKKWLATWGLDDVATIKRYSGLTGRDPVEFAKEWVKMDGKQQLEIYFESLD